MIRKCAHSDYPAALSGQSMIEYILVFVAVITVLLVALGPTGIFTQRFNESLDASVTGIECMSLQTCYDPAGCSPTCGNGCCEPGDCPADCP